MDQPELEASAHASALRGLARINAVSRTTAVLWAAVRAALTREGRDPGLPWRVLDLACGGGDVTIRLAKRAKRAGQPIQIVGADVSDRALRYARTGAQRAGVEARFIALDLPRDELPREYDVMVSNLFLHHLETPAARQLLARISRAAPHLIISDLDRSLNGLRAAQLGTHLLSRSPVVHVDGPRSVRAAFTADEARTLAAQAGLVGAQVQRRFPFRWLLTWSRT